MQLKSGPEEYTISAMRIFVLTTAFLASMMFFGDSSIHAQPSSPRGKPIRGEPIKKPAAPVQNAVAPVSTNNVTPSIPKQSPLTIGDFLVVKFDKLANYTFEVPQGTIANEQEGKSNDQIPSDVRALNKKRIALTGFMLPLKVDNGLVSEMLIMKDQSMCCYGAQPRINDWVSVKMSGGKGVKSVMDQPVTVFGEIQVGEMLENGYLIGIYQMQGEKMEIADQ